MENEGLRGCDWPWRDPSACFGHQNQPGASRNPGELVFFFDSLTALFALALLLDQPGLQLGLVGSQAVVHLLLLLQLQAQLGHAAVQLRTPTQPQGQSGLLRSCD